MTEPLCQCHGEAMLWSTDRRQRLEGFWRCRVRKAEANARYYASAKGKAAHARSRARRATA